MKTIFRKTKLFAAIFLMLWHMFPVSAQPTIYDISVTLPPGRSLIREYSGSDMVVYKYNYFAYIEDNIPYSNVIIHDLDLGLRTVAIYDMEILEDVLYFCGADTVSNIGKYGYVSIPELANSSISANVYIEDIPYFYNTGIKIEKALKLDVFKANGDYHIVMIGEYRNPANTNNIRCVVDAYCSSPMSTTPPATWTFEMEYEPGSIEYYTDIVATNRYVVTVAQKYGSEAEYIRFYDKPVFPGSTIFATTLHEYIYDYSNSPRKYQSHFVEHLDGDEIVTATIGDKEDVPSKTGILITHIDCGAQSVMDRQFIDIAAAYDPSWRIIDLKYDMPRHNLYVLANVNANANGLNNYIIDLPAYPFSPVPSTVNAFLPSTIHPMQSLTPVTPYPNNVVAIGDTLNVPTLYQHEMGVTSLNGCDSKEILSIMPQSTYIDNNLRRNPKDDSRQSMIIQTAPNIPTTTLNIQCQ